MVFNFKKTILIKMAIPGWITKNVDFSNSNMNNDMNFSGSSSVTLAKGNVTLAKGDITLEAGTLFSFSDERLKMNIRPIENALERIDKIKGVYYQWKDKGENSDQEIGVIAQDVQQQFPELVTTNKDGILAVDYAKLVAVLIECVKDLKEQLRSSSRLDKSTTF